MFRFVSIRKPIIRSVFRWNSVLYSKTSVSPKITLLDEEKEFFDILLRVVKDYDLKTTIRVAGGWVRDRIMGRPSKFDVDIALDNLTGVQFVTQMNEWNINHGDAAYKFNVIALNPDKSKHLETVQLNYKNLKVDIVHLRTEEYSTTSRIPTIALGTPTEDAYRRDLTINSLFYNINTQEVEDLTERGLEDLSSHLVRTPLPPLVTFTDDPLRALRAIRFACRFNFHIDEDLLQACKHEDVRNLLKEKVSRERIRNEIDLILATNHPHRGLYLFHLTGLLQAIIPPIHELHRAHDFLPSMKSKDAKKSLINTVKMEQHMDELFSQMIYTEGSFSVLLAHHLAQHNHQSTTNIDHRMATMTQSVLKGLHSSEIHYLFLTLPSYGWKSRKQSNRATSSAPLLLLQEGIRLRNKEISTLNQIQSTLPKLLQMCDELEAFIPSSSTHPTDYPSTKAGFLSKELQSQSIGPISRLRLGSLLVGLDEGIFEAALLATAIHRISHTLKEKYSWTPSTVESGIFHLALVLHLSEQGRSLQEEAKADHPMGNAESKMLDDAISSTSKTISQLLNIVEELQLQEIRRMELFFSGNDIMQMFPKAQGKTVGELKDLELKWMLCHPKGTVEEAKAFLQEYARLSAIL